MSEEDRNLNRRHQQSRMAGRSGSASGGSRPKTTRRFRVTPEMGVDPCPFDHAGHSMKSSDKAHRDALRDQDMVLYQHKEGHFWVGCQVCKATGPFSKDVQSAISSWNRRFTGGFDVRTLMSMPLDGEQRPASHGDTQTLYNAARHNKDSRSSQDDESSR